MKRKIMSLVIALAMVISVLPVSAAGTNFAGASPSITYSNIDNWSSENYTVYQKGENGEYSIDVGAAVTNKKQAFRVNSIKVLPNSTYYFTAMVKDGDTSNSNTMSVVNFHNGHTCLNWKVLSFEGTGEIGSDWKKISAVIEFKAGGWTENDHYCATQSHRQWKQGDKGWKGTLGVDVFADTTSSKYLWLDEGLKIPYLKNAIKGMEDGATYDAVIHAGFIIDSPNADKLLVKDFGAYKVEPLTATASMTAIENVGAETEITYTFSSAPFEAPTAENVAIEGGKGTVSAITKVSDTVYKVALSELEMKSKYNVTLSGLKDSEFGMALVPCTVSFATEGVKVLPEGVFVDEDFNYDEVGGAPSFFTGDGVVELKEGSTTDKVVSLTSTSAQTFLRFNLPQKVTAADGIVEFSFDVFRKNNTNQLMRFYLDNGNVISGQFYGTKLSVYPDQGILATPVQNGWNNIAIRVNFAKQIFTVALNGKVTLDKNGFAKEFTFRKASSGISGGYLNMDATSTAHTVLIDNFKVAKIEKDVDVISNLDFEGTSTGFTGGTAGVFTTDVKINDNNAENGIESGKAMQINHGVGTNTVYTFPTKVDNGIVEASFDLYRNANSPRIQFYFQSSAGAQVVSSPISGQWLGEHANAANIITVPYDKWTHITYRMNVYTKTFSVIVDGVEKTTYVKNGEALPLKFRNQDALDVAKIVLYVDATPANGADTRIQIDNLRVTTDVTNYGLSLSGNGIIVNNADNTVSGCKMGMSVGEFCSSVTTSPAGTYAVVYSSEGQLKADDDAIEKYDVVCVVNEVAGRFVKYTIIPDYSADFIGLTVNGNEYYEASKIIEPGEATVRTRITNNTDVPKTVTVYASVIGDKLYDVALSKNVVVPAMSKSDEVKLTVDIPDNSDSVKIKVMATDAQDGLSPLCDAETKPVYTSQITRMPNVFSDHMVLQRNEPVNIFGFAPTGTPVEVIFGENTATGVAQDGKFNVQLPAMAADSTGKKLIVTAGETTFTYDDVVVGEVLYGSGQSNMQRSVSYADGAIALGQIPNIRAFTSQSLYTTAGRVDNTITEAWKVLDNSNWKNVSGIMHCIAYYLRDMGAIPEDVVIGIVNASWGGTSIAMWLPADVIEEGPHNAFYTSYINRTPDSKNVRMTDLYSAMAKSIVPYTAKAAVWYQGEHDSGVSTYNWYMDELVKLMRKEFGKDIPYYAIQLPGFTTASWAQFRLTQWKSHDPENGVHIVVTHDTGDNGDIHPHDKDLVGEKVARHIAYHTYGMKNIPYQGPVFRSATASGNQVTISFDFVNDGLHGGLCSLADDNSLTKFEVSADGTTWYEAKASISGDTIVAASDAVASPAYVRFGYIDKILKSAGTNSNGVKLAMAPFSEAIN